MIDQTGELPALVDAQLDQTLRRSATTWARIWHRKRRRSTGSTRRCSRRLIGPIRQSGVERAYCSATAMNRNSYPVALAATFALRLRRHPAARVAPQAFRFLDKAEQAMGGQLGRMSLKPGEHVWRAEAKAEGPTMSSSICRAKWRSSIAAAINRRRLAFRAGKTVHDSPSALSDPREEPRPQIEPLLGRADAVHAAADVGRNPALHGGAVPGYPQATAASACR